jgi:tetratricopeptide (TPR) repeat protein
MTSQISKPVTTYVRCLWVLVFVVFSFVCAQAQQRQPSLAEQLAALQRLEAMYPDSLSPKVQQAELLLGYVCTNPQDSKSQQYVDEAQRVIGKIEALKPQKAVDRSDLATLHGFYYTALIVMSPQQNGPRYYRQALDNFDEALKLNPANAMAKQLQGKFRQGMGQTCM